MTVENRQDFGNAVSARFLMIIRSPRSLSKIFLLFCIESVSWNLNICDIALKLILSQDSVGDIHVRDSLSFDSVGMPVCTINCRGSDIYGNRHRFGVFVDTQSYQVPHSSFQTPIHFTTWRGTNRAFCSIKVLDCLPLARSQRNNWVNILIWTLYGLKKRKKVWRSCKDC